MQCRTSSLCRACQRPRQGPLTRGGSSPQRHPSPNLQGRAHTPTHVVRCARYGGGWWWWWAHWWWRFCWLHRLHGQRGVRCDDDGSEPTRPSWSRKPARFRSSTGTNRVGQSTTAHKLTPAISSMLGLHLCCDCVFTISHSNQLIHSHSPSTNRMTTLGELPALTVLLEAV